MSAEQLLVFEAIRSGPRGVVEGPLRIWLHSPTLAERSQALGEYCRYATGLPARLTELAIITIGAVWQAGFEWHVHAPIAAQAGVAAEAIEAIRRSEQPPGLSADEELVWRFTRSLTRDRELDGTLFAEAASRLGRKGIVDLVGLIGYYSYIAMTIVAFKVDVPGEDPFS